MAVSEKPWGSISAADYADADAWCAACLIDLNTGRDKTKGGCKLPIFEPGGALNRNGVHAAPAVLAVARGDVDAPPAAKRAAARKLIALYRQLREEAPESIRRLAQ